jgi:hypothetical protein
MQRKVVLESEKSILRNDKERFVRLLMDSDRELMTRDLADLFALLSASGQEGLWTPTLADHIAHVDPHDLLCLEWAAETHYASLMRQATPVLSA